MTRVRSLCDRPVASAKSFVEQPAAAGLEQARPLVRFMERRSDRNGQSRRIESMRHSIWEVLE